MATEAEAMAAIRAAGMLTNPKGTERLHQYWVHGEGAAKIRWGEPGDFDRCVLHLGKYIRDPQGYCNLAHHAALGFYPATHAAMIKHATGRADVADTANKPYGDVKYADPKNGKYPVDTEAHAKAAWSYINQAKNAAMYPLNGVTLSEVKDRIKAACRKFGIDIAEDNVDSDSSRGEPVPFVRSFPLEDISIRASGDGRTVDAYATVFDTPAPIRDQDGEYIEVIDRRAFDRILTKIAPSGGRTGWRCGVFYNHAMNLHGQPSDIDSMPIGVPLEIKADDHGLFTRTRYHKGDRADQVLEAIREGSISGYSFSGRFDRSTPPPPRGGFHADRRGNLPTVRRTESTLREYGPTPFPAYADAAITGVRSEQIIEQLAHITELLRSGAPLDSPELSAAPEDRGSAAEDSHLLVRSGRSVKEQIQANRAALLQRQYRS
jgi:HK97 family phage prohead protease